MNYFLRSALLLTALVFINAGLIGQIPPPPPPPPPPLAFPPALGTDTMNVTWSGKTKKKTRNGEWKAMGRNNAVVVTATYTRGVLNGNWESFYSDGLLRERGVYVNGKRNGVWIGLRSGGDSAYVAVYEAGVLHGRYRDFHSGNKLRCSGTFLHGKKEGEWIVTPMSFSRSRFIIERYEHDTLHGLRQSFYKDKLTQEETYVHGRKHGPAVEYDENGRVQRRGSFADGLADGPVVTYGRDGDTIEYGTFTKGRRSDYWEMRDRGKVTTRIWYSPAVKDAPPPQHGPGVRIVERPDSVYRYAFWGGLWEKEIFRDTTTAVWARGGVSQMTQYYEDTLLVKTTYTKVMGRTTGAVRNYYRNGQLSSVVIQQDNTWNGPAVWYHNNGALRARDTLHYSRLTDRVKLYDRKGKLIPAASKNYQLMLDSLFILTPGLRSSEPQTEIFMGEVTQEQAAEEEMEMPPPPVEDETEKVFSFAEEMPSFKGNNDAFKAYLKTNMRYPQAEKDAGETGVVYVYFEVGKDGSIRNVRTLKGVPGHPSFSLEAERLIREMPAWNPGKMNGRPVTVSMTVPVRFSLD